METTTSSVSEVSRQSAEHALEFDPRATLDLEAVERLRDAQHHLYEEAIEKHTADGFSQKVAAYYAQNSVESSIDHYLHGQGLSADDSRFSDYKNGLMDVSIINTTDDEWIAAFADESQTTLGQSGRDKTRALYTTLTGNGYYATPETLPEKPTTDPEIENLRRSLNQSRDILARLSAKRQGFVMGSGGEDYQEALATYNEQLTQLGRRELSDELTDESLSDTDKNALAINFIFEEQQRLRELTKQKLAHTPVGKFVEFMNRGNRMTRLAKGVGFGLAAAGVGAAIGAVAGAAGVVAIGGGVAAGATVVTRFARGFAQADAQKGRGLDDLTDTHATEAQAAATSDDTRLASINRYFAEALEKDTKKEQGKRRRAVIWGLGGVALGTTAGVALQAVVDMNLFDGAWNRPGGVFEAPSSPVEMQPDAPEPVAPVEQPAPVEPAPLPEVIADPNFSIESGEGGIYFFQSLGLSEADWYSVANELRQNFPNEFYTEGYDVRFAQPGQLSLEAQQFIKTRFGL